jgi:hypothetical protein
LSLNIESTLFTTHYQALRINAEFIGIARTESKKIIEKVRNVKHALLLSSRLFKSCIAWLQQGHVVAGDIQDAVGVEEDGTNSSKPESP